MKKLLLFLFFPLLVNAQRVLDKAQLPTITPDKLSQSSINVTQGFVPQPGLYIPVLTAGGMSGASGLSNHASGGIRATTGGSSGNGSLFFNRPIDPTKPFRIVIEFEINDATNSMTNIQITDAAADFFAGTRITAATTNFISGDFAGTTLESQYGFSGGISAGTQLYMCLVGDGTNVTRSIIPASAVSGYAFDNSPNFQVAYANTAYSKTIPITTTSSGHLVFGGSGADAKYRLCRIAIATSSATSRIMGVWASQSLSGPTDGQFQPPSMLKLTTGLYKDVTGWVVIPGQLGYTPTDIITLPHPNASNSFSNVYTVAFTNATIPTQLALGTAGMVQCGILGSQNSSGTSDATASNWGAPTGERYRKALIEWVQTNIPGTRYVQSLAQSMGGLNAMNFAMQYPGTIKSIAGVSMVCDLGDSFTNRGFGGTIQKAYSNWYINIQGSTGVDPSQVVTATSSPSGGATSFSVSALTATIPTGTTLTLASGSGVATVVTSGTNNSGATTLNCAALGSGITSGATYNMVAYWTLLTPSGAFSAFDDIYYQAPYTQRDLYASGTAYSINDIVARTPTITVAQLNTFDPQQNYYPLISIPIIDFHGAADATIPIAQATTLATSVNAKGGNMTVYSYQINCASASSSATTLTITVTAPSGTTLIPNLSVPTGTVLNLATGSGPATVTTTSVITAASTTVNVSAIGSGITSGVYGAGHLDASLYDGATINAFYRRYL